MLKLLFLLPLALQAMAFSSNITLLEPEVNYRKVIVRYTTQNFFPDDNDILLFQLAEDQNFSNGIVYHEQRNGNREYNNLPDGNYYVRALIKDADGQAKSEWSNVIWFQVFTPTPLRPTLLLVDSEPVTGDVLSLVWTALDAANLLTWQLQVSNDPDFPAGCGETLNILPAANQYEAEIPIDAYEGEGQLFFRIRARFPLDNSDWSNLLVVEYNRQILHYYSLAHLPNRAGWETWLQLNMPQESASENLSRTVTVSFLRDSELGDPELSRLFVNGLEPGAILRVPLSNEIHGTPVLLSSLVPLSVALHYRQNEAGDIGVVQISEFVAGRRRSLAALVERFESASSNRTFSGLVLANQSDANALVNLRFQILDTKTNLIVGERQEAVYIKRWRNQVFLLSDMLPEINGHLDQNLPLSWSVNVFAVSDHSGLDMLGATFNRIEGNLFPAYFQGHSY